MRRAVVFIRELVPRVAIACTARALYGPHFAELLRTPPRSTFVAVGSAVEVHAGRSIQPLT